MARLPAAPPLRTLIERSRGLAERSRSLAERSRGLAVLPFVVPLLRWRPLPRAHAQGTTTSARWFRILRITFVAAVIVPMVIASLYAGLVATPVYVSEARLAIRESLGERPASDDTDQGGRGAVSAIMSSLSGLLGGGQSRLSQTPFILMNYVSSKAFVAAIDKDGLLNRAYSQPGIDFLSRLSPDATLEERWRFWNRHVTMAVDRRSEIVLLRVRAFSAKEAQFIAEQILKDGEALLNKIVANTRAQSITRAQGQLDRARERYVEALVQQQEWRTRRRAVDPLQAAEALSQSLIRLEQERIAADREMRALEQLSTPDGPTLKVLRDRVHALNAEIADFRSRLAHAGSNTSAVEALALYEEAELEVRFAETMQAVAVAGLHEAERRARAQSAFVNVFVPPSLPSAASEPLWWNNALFIGALATIIWINAMVLIAVIRDHRH